MARNVERETTYYALFYRLVVCGNNAEVHMAKKMGMLLVVLFIVGFFVALVLTPSGKGTVRALAAELTDEQPDMTNEVDLSTLVTNEWQKAGHHAPGGVVENEQLHR